MTRTELNEIIKIFQKVYHDKFKIDQSGFNVWFECMGELRFDVSMKAANEFVRKSQFPPTIADIRNEYNILWEEHQALVRHINESFELAAGYYPMIDEKQRDRGKKIFIDVVGKTDKDHRERVAQIISQRIIEFVKQCEAGTDSTIEPFDQCMERIANEFRGRAKCNR